jgi:hypothetical protein
MAKHAILSPSGASRWMVCTPSARLEQQFPDKGSTYAAEGTFAHSLSELILREELGLLKKGEWAREFKKMQANEFYSEAMLDHCTGYAGYVIEKYSEAKKRTKDAVIHLEQKMDLTEWVEEGFGTIDTEIIADHILDIIDLKYGKGVPVTAVENKQLMLYGLGALRRFELMYDIQTVRITIYQPRLDTVSEWEISADALRLWAERELKPKAKLAYAGEGEYSPGVHCQFCKAKAVCKALADQQLEIAAHEFKEPNLLSDQAIADILSREKLFTGWIEAVAEHALNEAVNNGKKWPGFKLVEGRSNRVYTDETKVAETLVNAGFAEEIIYKPKAILGISAMEKVISKKLFTLHLESLVIKPAGKPTLVSVDDKRPEINSTENAKADFAITEA